MTINMGTPSPAPAGPAKTHAKEKKTAGNKDVAEAGSGFEAILSTVGQEQESDPGADASSKAAATGVDGLPTDAASTDAAYPSKDSPTDAALLLSHLGFAVLSNELNVDAAGKDGDAKVLLWEKKAGEQPLSPISFMAMAQPDIKSDTELTDRDSLASAGAKKSAKDQLSAEKLVVEGPIGKPDHAKDKLLDGLPSMQEGADSTKAIAPGESKLAKEQKTHQSEKLLAATLEAKSNSKELQAEQSQNKLATLLEMATTKDANAEAAQRPQEPFAIKSPVFDNVGSGLQAQAQPVASSQLTDTMLGSMAPADGVVGQQVNYWISSDVQSAEMKLDGLGKGPVEVSINVHGKEADVTFRTDEVQTRELLESSTGSLKELMGREGMVLTGMTVGAHGSGNPNPNGKGGGKHQQSLKPIIGSIAPSELANSALKPLGPIGKSLDLFV